MGNNFEDWKHNLEDSASEIIEPSPGDVEEAVYDAAVQMRDVEYIAQGERSIDEIIKELAPEGWRYRGPLSHKKVVAEEKWEIMIIGTGTRRYLFRRAKKLK